MKKRILYVSRCVDCDSIYALVRQTWVKAICGSMRSVLLPCDVCREHTLQLVERMVR